MSFHWLKDNVICYRLNGEILADVPELSPLQVITLIKNESISELGCVERKELLNRYMFISIRVYGDTYLWEVNDIYGKSIFVSEYRVVCEYIRDYIENVIKLYLSDTSRNIMYRVMELVEDNNIPKFVLVNSYSPIKKTSHLVIEINNANKVICVYFSIINGIPIKGRTYKGTISKCKSKIKRDLIKATKYISTIIDTNPIDS